MFQPTHPCGVRQPGAWLLGLTTSRFNPRTPAGCDRLISQHNAVVSDVSTHAPLRGATLTA